jgi:mobC-like protein
MSVAKTEKEPMTRLEIRLPKSTKQKLVDMCGNQISASEFIRQIIESGELPDLSRGSIFREKKELLEPLIVELSRIGNNVNQLARSTHYARFFYERNKDNLKMNRDVLLSTSFTLLSEEHEKTLALRNEVYRVLKKVVDWSNER